MPDPETLTNQMHRGDHLLAGYPNLHESPVIGCIVPPRVQLRRHIASRWLHLRAVFSISPGVPLLPNNPYRIPPPVKLTRMQHLLAALRRAHEILVVRLTNPGDAERGYRLGYENSRTGSRLVWPMVLYDAEVRVEAGPDWRTVFAVDARGDVEAPVWVVEHSLTFGTDYLHLPLG